MKNLLIVFLLLSVVLKAQEGLKPLHSNLAFMYPELNDNETKPTQPLTAKTNSVPIQLPFIEDFYYATLSFYPKQLKWSDSLVFVNTGFPIAPPSIGVATFDGLNKNGYPYEPNYTNLSESRPADTLTSKDINLFQSGSQILQVSDSIALSFYYQARGNGEAPELGDSLILDFFKPKVGNQDSVWINRVWFAKGNSSPNTNDTAFKRAFIWIDDTAYYKPNFRFRFRNKATTSGNFDHWHLDYVYLNKNRSELGDTLYNDLTFAHVPSSFLSNYSAMPYQQYSSSDMAQKNSVRIKNNGGQSINMSYENRFYAPGNNLVHSYSGGANGNLLPFKPNGYSQFAPHANPVFNYTFGAMPDSIDYTIKHFLYRSQGNSSDFLLENDTIYQKQIFRNYYAYDDGGAEGGYYVNGVDAKVALRFSLNFTDTLRAVRIYFDPAAGLATVEQLSKFRLCIWANTNGGPGQLIYKDSVMYPKYFDSDFKSIPQYTLSSPIVLGPGSYFIGFQQNVADGIVIGFDRNQHFQHQLYYDIGFGWTQSQIKGALMFRPVFGKFIASPASLKENSAKDFMQVEAFPNPANDFLQLNFNQSAKRSISLYNALGQRTRWFEGVESSFLINTFNLESGIYFIIIEENNSRPLRKKIIIQH